MPIILRDRDTHIAVTSVNTVGTVDHIAAQVYKLRFDPIAMELNLVKDRKNYQVPEMKFGRHKLYRNAIISRYDRLNDSLGVLLSGLKGSGKSLLGEDMANWMIAAGLPVLVVDVAVPVSLIQAAISVIGPCMVYFDEFGKIYTEDNDRNMLLTLFSDSSNKGVLFLITGNTTEEFTEYMINRPGRFELHIAFNMVTVDMAIEIADHYHLEGAMRDIFLLYVAARTTSVDILIKLALTLRTCKTMEEAEFQFEIMNIPYIAYYSIMITQAFYKGELISSTRLAVKENDRQEKITLALLNEMRQTISTFEIDFNDPRVEFVSKDDSTRETYRATSEFDHAALRTGEYTLVVNEELTITFYRDHSSSGKGKVFLNSMTDDERIEARRKHEEWQKKNNGSLVHRIFDPAPNTRVDSDAPAEDAVVEFPPAVQHLQIS